MRSNFDIIYKTFYNNSSKLGVFMLIQKFLNLLGVYEKNY